MTQIIQVVENFELDVSVQGGELHFLEDAIYEYVGGGDAFNGY